MSDLFRLVYASKNLLQGTDAEVSAAVRQILEASQRNNTKVGVTGALMFNAGAFAQVLEGPRRAVEATFERIQCDPRHGDVTVLQCGPVDSRGFANWSMAFVGQSAAGQTRFSRLADESGFDLSRLNGDGVFAMLRDLMVEEEGLPGSANGLSPISPASVHPAALDEGQIRSEIAQLWPSAAAAPAVQTTSPSRDKPVETASPSSHRSEPVAHSGRPATEAAIAVLKMALASERERTTDLRSAMDDLQVALAVSQDQLDALRQERDLWAERARVLATALAQEASDVPIAASRSNAAGATPVNRSHPSSSNIAAA